MTAAGPSTATSVTVTTPGTVHGRRPVPGCDLDYAIHVAGAHPIAAARSRVYPRPDSPGPVRATATEIQPLGRVTAVLVPAAELAVIVHPGSHADVDLAYGALATYVTSHALQVDGPIREYYLVGRHDTADENAWRTEICWPIFSTVAAA